MFIDDLLSSGKLLNIVYLVPCLDRENRSCLLEAHNEVVGIKNRSCLLEAHNDVVGIKNRSFDVKNVFRSKSENTFRTKN